VSAPRILRHPREDPRLGYLRGIVVHLKTGAARWAGTDDPLYVGVSGTGGGREFPLDVRWHDDFERLSELRYALGEVWDEPALVGARRPRGADVQWNDPRLFYVDLGAVDRVYLRKHPGRRRGDDDAYQLDEIEVGLYGDPPARRLFRSTTAIWLGIQYGLQVWIPEETG
jgi:hypothetical protein